MQTKTFLVVILIYISFLIILSIPVMKSVIFFRKKAFCDDAKERAKKRKSGKLDAWCSVIG